jgi:transcription antitermination factor NusG
MDETGSSGVIMPIPRHTTVAFAFYLAVVLNFSFVPLPSSSVRFVAAWQAYSSNQRLLHRPAIPQANLVKFDGPLKRFRFQTDRSQTISRTTLLLAYKLWDRLSIEEDEEPMWYLLNCVATNELDLLRQCRALFDDSCSDVVKFVVPLEKKTRSHGANKMLTETKVMYPGYVFAKLRLCPHVYEAIQSLDLCRSWMGTVNHKGYKKLPPVPVALNEVEIENFGLEDIDENVDDDGAASHDVTDADGIIIDSSEDDDENDDEYSDPMYRNVDKKALKQFLGLKVEDMVKVIKPGKFHNEDGIVRRLKEGRIFIRFYTYGTMFEEWLEPSDVRKLTAEEILKGLGGRSQPITQRDFDGPSSSAGNYRPRNMESNRATDLRGAFGKPILGEQRNRRQDRAADRFKSNSEQQRDADNNWKWYKEQQQNEPSKQNSLVGSDDEWSIRAGSKHNTDQKDDWAESDVDSQWGRKPQRQVRKENQKTLSSFSNRQMEAAIDGKDDWSAFVSSASNVMNPEKSESDDFFASLMSDLNKDLNPSTRENLRAQPQNPKSVVTESHSNPGDNGAIDEFFSTLMSDLTKDLGSDESIREKGRASNQQNSRSDSKSSAQKSEDDFFASLLSDLKSSPPPTKENYSSPKSPMSLDTNSDYTISQDDAFFASLEAELDASLQSNTITSKTDPIDFLSDFQGELVPYISERPSNKKSHTTLSSVGEPSTPSPSNTMPLKSSSSDLNLKTVPVLKELLRERGLKVSGTKAELVKRLLSS